MFEYLIPAAASLISGGIQSSAASSAAAAQAAAAERAAALQEKMLERQIGLQEPFRQAGLSGQNRLMELLGLRMPAQAGVGGAPAMRSEADLRNALASQYTTPGYSRTIGREGETTIDVPAAIDEARLSDAIRAAQAQDQAALTAYQGQQATAAPSADFGKYARDFGPEDLKLDTGYDFRVSEGLKALERQAAARGGLISGAALKAAQRYGQDAASQEFTNAFNRYQTSRESQLNPLLSLAGRGQVSSNTLGSAAGQYGTNVGNMYLGTGEAQGNAMLAGAQARGSAYQGIGNILGRSNALGNLFGSSNPFVPSQPYDVPYYGPQ